MWLVANVLEGAVLREMLEKQLKGQTWWESQICLRTTFTLLRIIYSLVAERSGSLLAKTT